MLEWSEFARRLGRELTALERDTILIVREREESRHYVQAMREPDRLYAEAVSNNFLDGPLLLTLADEEVMSDAGWRPPADPGMAGPRNWWTELPAFATAADYARLAEVMVTALRDVQAVRRPSDLVYESFHRHGTGLVGLPDLGLDCADPSRITRTRAADPLAGSGQAAFPEPNVLAAEPGALPPALPDAKGLSGPVPNGFPGHPSQPQASGGQMPPGGDLPGPSIQDMLSGAEGAPSGVMDEIEPRLAEAKERGDHTTYFDLLPTADLVFPDAPGESTPPTISLGTGTYITVFTSPGALARVSSQPTPFRRTSFADLSANWPDPAWQLAINPGLASEIHLDITAVARLGAVPPGSSTPVPPPSGGVSVPPPMGTSPAVPGGLADQDDAHTRHDLQAVGPHDRLRAPGAPLAPGQDASLGVPAQYDEFGAHGSQGAYAGQDPSATPQMPGLPVRHDQLGSPDGQPQAISYGNPAQRDERGVPGLPAPRDGFGSGGARPESGAQRDELGAPGAFATGAGDVPEGTSSPLEMTQHDELPGVGTPGMPRQDDSFATLDAPGVPAFGDPHALPGFPDRQDSVGAPDMPGLPAQADAFGAPARPDRQGGPDVAGFPGQGDAHAASGVPGQQGALGGPDLAGAPSQGDAFATAGGPGQPGSLGAPDGAGLPAYGGPLGVPGVPEQQDSFGAPDATGVPTSGDPFAAADVPGQQDVDVTGRPAQGDGLAAPAAPGQPDSVGAAGVPAQNDALEPADARVPEQENAFGVSVDPEQRAFVRSRVADLRDAFAGAGAGRRDSATAGGLREFDTSGMPILPGLEAHGTAAMPAAAPVPVPDGGYATAAPAAHATVLRVPHGTALLEVDGTGEGTPVAVYDAIGSVWTPVRADALPGQRGE
ncbi:TY-Chap domain-containing protein [Actinomadura oligospora]|uniref:TY-Chap domain-containing protein n=1 Tax=Actinomadura oligospora TaxID=111804 RepID=UPI0012FC2680|nr:hypothetical protein [Actinomadura oligospora]